MRTRTALQIGTLTAAALLAGLAFLLGTARDAPAGTPIAERVAGDRCVSVVEGTLRRMTLREKVGQMVMVLNAPGFPGFVDTEALIRDHGVGSVVSLAYFGLGPADAARRNNALQRAARSTRLGIPILNAADFEKGTSMLIARGATDLPSQMGLGATRRSALAGSAARITAAEARAMGFHWTFSPVADIVTTRRNGEIGVRSFGGVRRLVARMTRTQVAAFQGAGLMATAKHFPGLGGAAVNSHFDLPRVGYSRRTLDRTHLHAFRAAVAAGVDAVMTGHVVVEAVDELPATLSRRVTTGLLRRQLGYRGLVVTDSMTLGAIVSRWGVGEAAVLAVNAGADVIMEIGDTSVPLTALAALRDAVRAGEIPLRRVHAAVRRVLAAKCEYGVLRQGDVDPADAAAAVGTPASLARAERMSTRAITLVRNRGGVLPFDASAPARTLVAGVTHHATVIPTPPVSHVPAIAAEVARVADGPVSSWSAATEDPTRAEIATALRRARSADRVVVATYSAGVLPDGQARLVRALLRTGKPVAAVSIGTPYDLLRYPRTPAYVASYAFTFLPTYTPAPAALRAAVRVVFGAQPGGRLPVPIGRLYRVGHGLQYPAAR